MGRSQDNCLHGIPGRVEGSTLTTQAYFVLRFPILRWASPLLFNVILQGIAAGIGTSNFLRAAFIVRLNSSSSGSTKNIHLNCQALSSFGFSIAHLCFAFFFAASDINFHFSGHTSYGREAFRFLEKSKSSFLRRVPINFLCVSRSAFPRYSHFWASSRGFQRFAHHEHYGRPLRRWTRE